MGRWTSSSSLVRREILIRRIPSPNHPMAILSIKHPKVHTFHGGIKQPCLYRYIYIYILLSYIGRANAKDLVYMENLICSVWFLSRTLNRVNQKRVKSTQLSRFSGQGPAGAPKAFPPSLIVINCRRLSYQGQVRESPPRPPCLEGIPREGFSRPELPAIRCGIWVGPELPEEAAWHPKEDKKEEVQGLHWVGQKVQGHNPSFSPIWGVRLGAS